MAYKMTQTHKDRIRNALKGKMSKPGKLNPNYKDGHCCNPNYCIDCGVRMKQHLPAKRCFKCNMKFLSGENAPNWKGGVTPLYIAIRACKKYYQWRSDVYYRDKWTCQTCKAKGDIHAHHIKSFLDIIKENNITTLEDAINCLELWDINNGVTLCRKCHELTDNYYRWKKP